MRVALRILTLTSSSRRRASASVGAVSAASSTASDSFFSASDGGRYSISSRRSSPRTHQSSSWGSWRSAIGLPLPARSSNSPRSWPSRMTRSTQVSKVMPGGFRSVIGAALLVPHHDGNWATGFPPGHPDRWLLGGNLAAMAGVKGQVQARGVERRRAIVAAAIEHFAENGYHGTAIADIAKQAGVTTGGCSTTSGRRSRSSSRSSASATTDAIGAVSSLEHDSIAEHFDEWLSVAAWNEEREPYVALHAVLLTESIDPDHPAHAYFTARNRWLLELLSDALRKGVERGELRDDFDVTSKAREIQAFVEGAAIMWLFDPEPGGLQRRYRSYFDDQLEVLRAH